MAIFGLFKKDKSKPSSSQASSSSLAVNDAGTSEDYAYSSHSLLPPKTPIADDGYSSSAQSFVSTSSAKKPRRFPFAKKQQLANQKSMSQLRDNSAHSPLKPKEKLSLNLDRSVDILPSPRSSVFPSFHHSSSSPTLAQPPPADDIPSTRPQLRPVQNAESPSSQKSAGGLFGWRERKKSKSSIRDEELVLPPLTDDSFNLKSFRHVLPEPRPASPQRRSPTPTQQSTSASNSSLLPPARPRGPSVASTDSSQRISVAAFREAQARRSSTNLTGSPSPTIRPVSVANSSISDLALPKQPRAHGSPAPSASPTPTQKTRQLPRQSPSKRASSSSDTSSSEESDSDVETPSRSRSRLSRQRTITKSYRASSDLGHGKSPSTSYSQPRQSTASRSDLGHGSPARTSHHSPSPARGPPPSSFQKSAEAVMGTRSFGLYRRQQASLSASELNHTAASQRANVLKQANSQDRSVTSASTSSDTSDTTSDSESSDDDAPLATLAQPKRPGSAFSHSSSKTSTSTRKPLIDLNTKINAITGKPLIDENKIEHPPRSTLISPTDINGRLSRLTVAAGLGTHTKNLGSKSVENFSAHSSPRPTGVERSQPISPASTVTITPPLRTHSPEPMDSSSRRMSLSAISTVEATRQRSTENLKPIPVQGRENDRGFRVVSRPLKSPTSPPISASSLPARQSPEKPSATHRHSSSVHSNASSRPQSSMVAYNTPPPIVVKDMKAQSIPSASSSASSVPTSSSAGQSSSSFSRPGVQSSPQRPFIVNAKRRDSPASSTGGSSNGKAPLTPNDGSDYFSPHVHTGNGESPGGSSARSTPQSAMKGGRGHIKRASVSFQEETMEDENDVTIRGRKSSYGLGKAEYESVEDRENRRKERRRSEAKAAIEFGNVVNGKGPVLDDDDEDGSEVMPTNNSMPQMMHNNMSGYFNPMAMGWPQQGMPPQMMGGMGPMTPMGGMPPMNMGVNPQNFMITPPPPDADTAFLAAHQQAMRIAKQAYQYAVAQQAMAAAGDEWERGSSVSGFAPSGSGMNLGMGGYGMNGMWGQPNPMFPPAPRSMYGSNMGGAQSEAGWGTASVYGESFGPASQRRSQLLSGHKRNSSGGTLTAIAFPNNQFPRGDSSNNIPQGAGGSSTATGRQGPRPRTRTAPSNSQLPPQHRNSKIPAPPSSWKVGP